MRQPASRLGEALEHEPTVSPQETRLRAGAGRRYAALMSMILNFMAPRGAETSTVSPFLWPRIALPTGDSFDSLFSAGFASAEPTIWYSNVLFASTSRRRTVAPIDTTSEVISDLSI